MFCYLCQMAFKFAALVLVYLHCKHSPMFTKLFFERVLFCIVIFVVGIFMHLLSLIYCKKQTIILQISVCTYCVVFGDRVVCFSVARFINNAAFVGICVFCSFGLLFNRCFSQPHTFYVSCKLFCKACCICVFVYSTCKYSFIAWAGLQP